MNDLLGSSNYHARGAADLDGKDGDVDMAGTSDVSDGGADMAQFFAEVGVIKNDMASIRKSLQMLQDAHEETKTVTNAKAMKALKEQMGKDIDDVSMVAQSIKRKIEALDKANIANRKKPNCGEGSSTDRRRMSITATLKKELEELMSEFQNLQQRSSDEYWEVIVRRLSTGAWATHPKIKTDVAGHILFGLEGKELEQNSLVLARYDFKENSISEPKPMLFFQEGGSPPRKIAVHPKGDGVVISFETGCKLFTWGRPPAPQTKLAKEVELKLQPSEAVLPDLEDVGPQSCIRFSDDGTLLASAGENGHLRLFQWPSMEVVVSLPNVLKSVKDLDISLDNGFLSATGDNSPCKIWDLKEGKLAATIEPTSGESFGFSKFSRNLKKAFLFVTIAKDKKGYVGVWDMINWNRIGAKRFLAEPITSFAITHHGRRLAMGTRGGDISIVETDKMNLTQIFRNTHSETVTSLEFSPNDKVILSLSSDLSSRVSALDLSKEWKDWQIYLVLLGMFLGSMVLFYMLYAFGDSLFQVPEGRIQYDKHRLQQARQVKDKLGNFASHEEF